ncbi:proline dehydrogenase family protein [Naasia sp. SYSU D00057]|uniref:proline dehydrogenase family protein n=1 Tax=Naasia sp. SYSU D00057 TaxID=2817380 RepID=UPI001B30FDB5|nr:proline dehydrogenase family protein [Naasia sp. SYSU D00057]
MVQVSEERTVALVRSWLARSADAPTDAAAARLAGVLRDPKGLPFTVGFIDGVVRPEDLRVAARNLWRLRRVLPRFLPLYQRAAILAGGLAGLILPWPVVPIAREVLRRMVGHLVLDATPRRLGRSIARLRSRGARLNLNLLGEAVLGEDEAKRRLAGTRKLLARDDVDYVSVKVSAIAGQLTMWGFDETVDRVVDRLLPLYRFAASSPSRKFINLDMEEYRDLDLTLAVFMRLLDLPELRGLEAGIVLQAYLPDALDAMQRLNGWARERRGKGGAAIKVRVVKGANLAMERVDAAVHDWPLATLPSKQETDTNYKRVLDWAMTPERTDAVRLGVAGHNLFDLAYAWLLAQDRGVTDRVDVEMLLGMATGQAAAISEDVGGLLLYTPVVAPREFDVAISYLVRRLEENASDENFMSAVFDLASDEGVFQRERERFARSLAALREPRELRPNRRQDRRTEQYAPRAGAPFENEPDTDPSLPANREWGRAILARAKDTRLGVETLREGRIETEAELDRLLAGVARAGAEWGARSGAERAAVLERAAAALAAARAELLEIAAFETGKTLAEGDPEVSEAIDFAAYYAERARELDEIPGADFVPAAVTLVAPPWNFPASIPAGSVLAALAAGSGVVFKPAPQARRVGAVLAEALRRAGFPRDLLAFADVDEETLGRRLIEDPRVDRVVLTGSWETAALFRSWRPDLPLLAETSGKNSIIVTPSADLDLAAADVVKSAFGHAGQKCSAASLVILVGSAAKSGRFLSQLADATRSLTVGPAEDPATQMGPVIEPPSGKLLDALTTLGDGEEWLVQPERRGARLWTPGIRTGVQPGSPFHLTEYFGPVLGVMTAASLDEAIELQNAVPFGLTAGLHSLDPDEVTAWAERVQAGNLYVNRGITGAIVRRQPFGGWKRSSVGGGAKAGGPNYLYGLGTLRPQEVAPGGGLKLAGLSKRVGRLLDAATGDLSYEGFEFVRTAARHDEDAWQAEFGVVRDATGLGVERNLFRYRPADITLRLPEGAPVASLVRLAVAAARTRAETEVSTAWPLSERLRNGLLGIGIEVRDETDDQFAARVREGLGTSRLRMAGGEPGAIARLLGGDPDLTVYDGPVTTAGRVELLAFLREQAVSITAHRFGALGALDGVLPETAAR